MTNTAAKTSTVTTSTIDEKTLIMFLVEHKDSPIGFIKKEGSEGKITTLYDEMGIVGNLIYKAYTGEQISFYQSRKAYAFVEDKEIFHKISCKRYMIAARKILFLNSMCKKYTGRTFINRPVNISRIEEAEALVDDFDDCVRNHE